MINFIKQYLLYLIFRKKVERGGLVPKESISGCSCYLTLKPIEFECGEVKKMQERLSKDNSKIHVIERPRTKPRNQTATLSKGFSCCSHGPSDWGGCCNKSYTVKREYIYN